MHADLLRAIKQVTVPSDSKYTQVQYPQSSSTKNPKHKNGDQPKYSRSGKCHFCKKDGHWINECKKMKKEFPDETLRNKIIDLIKISISSKTKQTPMSQISIKGSLQSTEREQEDYNLEQTEIKSTSKSKSDVAGVIAGTVEEIPSSLQPISCNPQNESLYLPVTIHGIHVNSLLDSGSTLTVLHPDTYYQIPQTSRPNMIGEQIKLRMADGGVIQSLGEVQVEIALGDQVFQHVATIADIESSAVIGYDFLKKHGCCLDFGCSTLLVNGVSLPCVRLNQLTENLHITIGETVTLAPYSETIETCHY